MFRESSEVGVKDPVTQNKSLLSLVFNEQLMVKDV